MQGDKVAILMDVVEGVNDKDKKYLIATNLNIPEKFVLSTKERNTFMINWSGYNSHVSTNGFKKLLLFYILFVMIYVKKNFFF